MQRAAGAACLISAVLLMVSLGTNPTRADNSSWFGRSEEAPPKKPAAAAPSKPAASDVLKTVPVLVPATGDDAAYLAFDQGQYLTALKLAQEAASRGEPTAHTLIARIYAEGLGVPKDEKAAVNWYARAAELGDIPATFSLEIGRAHV